MATTNTRKKFILGNLTAVVLSALALSACGSPEAATPQQPMAPQISVANVLVERITEWDEFTGRLQAPETVTLMPRVSGYIESVNFAEGALVKQGEPLFQIDSRAFKAEVARLKANLESAKTANTLAINDYQRAKTLSDQKAISAEMLDSRFARKQQSLAEVAAIEAALMKAELDLSFTTVTAPITGRVSNALITRGNYVNAGQSQLTQIVSTAKMYAYFDIDEQTYLKYAQLSEQGKRADNRSSEQSVYLALANETEFNRLGAVDFVDNSLNQQTGTLRLRASFDNAEGDLLPGLFAKIRLAGSASYDGVLIDDKAIGTDLSSKYVLLVNDTNQLEYRPVTLGEKVHGLRIVTQGLTAKDRIVINGMQKVRPGMQVEPNMLPMAPEAELEQLRQKQARLDKAQQALTAQTATSSTRG
ncbi:efflux RND transporter periplasmic adaptor subunit [Shewanella sp. SR44-3]|uniref:efflux RND transporter periplasmic adaptor subunit n=1 Tax=Shewanella sp. SR44-3 TaxID=2760936 RepID=UPI0015FB5BC6|nr:efflux RND transporter periplasmic adaptor subunit [Shewanella sp. SR44-3]MBB1269013.1 efflux RND transporter periplasmic adaptor subunit [Shewanella sp. SR44-3]